MCACIKVLSWYFHCDLLLLAEYTLSRSWLTLCHIIIHVHIVLSGQTLDEFTCIELTCSHQQLSGIAENSSSDQLISSTRCHGVKNFVIYCRIMKVPHLCCPTKPSHECGLFIYSYVNILACSWLYRSRSFTTVKKTDLYKVCQVLCSVVCTNVGVSSHLISLVLISALTIVLASMFPDTTASQEYL